MTYDGIIVKGNLTRLADVGQVVGDNVDVKITCGVDPQGLVIIEGSASSHVEMACQRCGEELEIEVRTDFIYTPMAHNADESDEPIPDAYDQIELNEYGELNLIHLVEDELMLALPIVAMHEPSECSVSEQDMTFGELAPEATEEKKSNPFDVLKQLKN
jgi:uncharacterized protein